MRADFKRLAGRILWQLFLISLPFSSFPLLSRLFGGTSVAPLALVFMAALALVVVVPALLKDKTIPSQVTPLVVFFLLALCTSALAYFRQVPSFRAISLLRNGLEGFFTLLLGIGFYWVTIICVRDEEILLKSLRWINVGAIITLVLSFAQVLDWNIVKGYSEVMWKVQSWISASGMLYPMRATGTAFEPSWLAHQLNTLFLPLWLGLSVQKKSAYCWRLFRKITVENLLLFAGLLVLFLSFSRIGWLTMVFLAGYLVFRAANQLLNSLLDSHDKHQAKKRNRLTHFLYKGLLWLAVVLGLLAVLLLLGLLLTRIDPRMERLFDLNRYRQFGLLGWASQLSFAERLIYWISGFRVCLQHPFMGVGLGASGYYFPNLVPEFGFKLPEIVSMLFFRDFIPNAKNLWVRLLAETGVVGLSVFVAWLYLHWHNAASLERKNTAQLSGAIGLIGKLFLLALLVEAFSMDTFGLPYFWVALGLATAAFRMNQIRSSQPSSVAVTDSQGSEDLPD